MENKYFTLVISGSTREKDMSVIDSAVERFASKFMRTMGFHVTDTHITLALKEGSAAALLAVDFASDIAAEEADDAALPKSAFTGVKPSGTKGYTAADVRALIANMGY